MFEQVAGGASISASPALPASGRSHPWHHRQQQMRGMVLVVEDGLPSHLDAIVFLVRAPGIQVARVVGEVRG